MARSSDENLKPKKVNEGDSMLKNILPFKEDPHGKFKSNYEGPCLFNKVLSGKASILSEMDGMSFLSYLIVLL